MPDISIPAGPAAASITMGTKTGASVLALTGAATGKPVASSSDTPSLATFIDLMTGQATPAPVKAPPGGTARQDDADTGNPLPDEKGDQPDPALAWMLAAPAIVTPLPAPTAPVVPTGGALSPIVADVATPVAPPMLPLAPVTADVAPTDAPILVSPAADATIAAPAKFAAPKLAPLPRPRVDVTPSLPVATPPDPATAPVAAATPSVWVKVPPVLTPPVLTQPVLTPITTVDTPSGAPVVAPTVAPTPVAGVTPAPVAPIRVTLPRQPSPRLLVQLAAATQPTPNTAATVAQPALFALAGLAGRATLDRDDRTGAPVTDAITQIQATTAHAVAATGDAQQQTLDLGNRDWPQKMIEHIESLRDNANANDTSIRLKPEALGRVDVALRTHDNGAISVRFTAEQPTTRTLLADAAPQLAQAAEARGIRLSGTSVDLAGSGQGDQRPRPEVERQQSTTNRFAIPTGDDTDAVDDGRIA